MKTILFFITTIMFPVGILAQGQEISLKPYGIKSGIIEYSYSGDKIGKGTLYFDKYGTKSAMFTDVIEDGENRKRWIVTSGDYQYIWDPDHPAEGMKLKNPLIDWKVSASITDIESFTESIYAKIGMEKSGTETMLGKDCKVLKGKMGKVMTWNGILMLLEMKTIGYSSHQEATKAQIDVPVEAKYFVIPKNIRFSEMPGF